MVFVRSWARQHWEKHRPRRSPLASLCSCFPYCPFICHGLLSCWQRIMSTLDSLFFLQAAHLCQFWIPHLISASYWAHLNYLCKVFTIIGIVILTIIITNIYKPHFLGTTSKWKFITLAERAHYQNSCAYTLLLSSFPPPSISSFPTIECVPAIYLVLGWVLSRTGLSIIAKATTVYGVVTLCQALD